jgi:hypothetical protein
MKIFSNYCFSVAIFLVMSLNCFSAFAADKLDIIHNEGLLTVMAEDAMPEDIFLTLGKECNIEIIVKGRKFPENGVTIALKDMPIKDAVKRLASACALKSYFMEFKKDDQGKSRLVKINLSVGGSGQRRLTSTQQKKQNKRPYKSTFSKDTDFQWDGSAPIAFPEFQGELAYDKSEFGWDESAKSFSGNTMDLVPPGVRDMVAEQIIKMSDQIAKERGTDTITSDITAEALQRIGKQAGMPSDVMKLMPKSADDFDKPKIPIDPSQLQENYRD